LVVAAAVYVARSQCHIFFKLCGLFLAISNYLWVFLIQYKRFSKSNKAAGVFLAGCKAGMEVTAVGDVVNGPKFEAEVGQNMGGLAPQQ
jgi:hypothetical protein